MKTLIYSSFLLVFALLSFQGSAQTLNSESFDAPQFLPTGWAAVGTAPDWARVTTLSAPLTGGPHSGTGMARMRLPNGSTAASVTETIATPVFDLSGRGTNAAPMSFWIYRDSLVPANADSLAIYVNTSASLTGAIEIGKVARNRSINVPDTKASNGWYQYTFDIPLSFAGASNYILFKGTVYGPTATARRLVIDDVNWTSFAPACNGTPTAGTLSAPQTTFCGGQGNTTITLANAAIGTGISYQWFTSSSQAGPYVALTNSGNVWPTGNLNGNQYYYVTVACGPSGLSANTDTLAIVVNTTPLPTVSISMLNDTICQGDTLVLNASGAATYAWSTQQNPTLGTGSSISVAPMNTTTYTLVGTDASGCASAPVTQAIVVGRKPIINNLSNTNNTLCLGGTSTLSVQATSGVGGPGGGGVTLSYQWSPNVGSTATVTVAPTSTTLYTVTVIGQYGCSSTDTTTVFVDPTAVSPSVSLNQDSINVCQGQTNTIDLIATSPNAGVTYAWSSTGQPVSNSTPTLSVTPGNQTTTYTILVTDPTNGCTAAASATLYIHAVPNVNATTTTPTVCTNGSGVVNAQVFAGPGANLTGYTFSWTPTGATTQLTTVTPTQDTYYTVVVTSPFGCSNTDSVQVLVDPTLTSPSISLTASTTAMCSNNLMPVDLIATTDATNPTFSWTPNFISQNSPNITVNPQNSMNVTVTVTDQNGCTTATGVSIQVVAPPTANATWVSSPNNVIDFTNGSSNATAYSWDFGDGTVGVDANPSHTYPSEGTWNVTLIASNAGCSDTISFDVVTSLAALAQLDFNIKLHPNPVQDYLQIECESGLAIRVLDVSAQEVMPVIYTQGKTPLDFSKLRPGIYFVELSKDQQRVVKRVVKD
ncbi:MAG: hypothetical protein RLZZ301_1101 [Bacteroidota bacterium]|jgi:hypothetical protein